ncbi:MAG: hypothetical protein MI700_10150 [Balneolales bacterium]|nr:hypothetical protein [Balneolales bacterium]
MLKKSISILCLILFSTPDGLTQFIDWQNLSNPIYTKEGWSVKDATMIYSEENETFYLFFSAFFFDNGRERCHVSGVKTKDFKSFSEPLFIWDGQEEGWIGMCSPNLTVMGDTYVLTYNSWGDKRGAPNQLFYAVSNDLENWEYHLPLAKNLTDGVRAIDAALYVYDDTFYLMWKRIQTSQVSFSATLDEGWMNMGRTNLGWFENAEMIDIDNKMHLIGTFRSHKQFIYTMKGLPQDHWNWTEWELLSEVTVPEEGFNTDERMNAGFLVDWRKYDGYFYYLYAGRTEGESHAGRGNQKLALARSKDLMTWETSGNMNF